MHFDTGRVVRAVSRMLHSKRHSTSRLARRARLDERDRRDTQLSLFEMYYMYKVMIAVIFFQLTN